MHHHFARFQFRTIALCILPAICFAGNRGSLCLLPARADAGAQSTNATPDQFRAIETGIARLSRDVEAGDTKTLDELGLTAATHTNPILRIQAHIDAAAVSLTGALVKLDFTAWGSPNDATAAHVIGQGALEIWLNRSPVVGGEVFTPDYRHWIPPSDASDALAQAAGEEWTDVSRLAANDTTGAILHLVAQKLGGRWIALRRSRWDGVILDNAHLSQASTTMPGVRDRGGTFGVTQNVPAADVAGDVKQWLAQEMEKQGGKGPGIAHFVLQRSQNGWVGLDSVWDGDRNVSDDDERIALQWRTAMDGPAYLTAASHRDFSTVLAHIGLFGEAFDEAGKANALNPGIVTDARVRELDALRPRDPQAMAALEVQNEMRIGIGQDHPVFVLKTLAQALGNKPTVLGSLQIGLEYSKLAQDDRAAAWLKYADDLIARDGLRNLSDTDMTWAQILHDQLSERRKYAGIKPPDIIRSGLFTLRCWPNDLNTIPVLAGLEAAQHVVYADFGVPMGNTEVVLWRNQSEFQAYTGRVAGEATSEFIAALTLTKLVHSQEGPVVLSDEINVFTDPRGNTISTLRHEYGHVAVREMTKGRDVPMWLNEGIATSVEGGYDGYLQRVRDAAGNGSLLSMDEMLAWNVDGERAFLAYSQANSMIDYIGATWGPQAVLDILRLIGRDVAPETALHTVLKVSSQQLWNRWSREGIR